MKRYLGKKKLLRIYLDSTDTYAGEPLWLKLLEAVREEGLAGATVLKGVAGIGIHTQLHRSGIWSLSEKLPVVLEIVEDEERALAFLEKYGELIGEGMVAMTDVEVLRYKNRSVDEYR